MQAFILRLSSLSLTYKLVAETSVMEGLNDELPSRGGTCKATKESRGSDTERTKKEEAAKGVIKPLRELDRDCWVTVWTEPQRLEIGQQPPCLVKY